MVYSFYIVFGVIVLADNRTFKDKIKIIILIKLIKLYFHTEKYVASVKNINYPKVQCIFAMWHCHQILTYGIENKEKFYTLISASNDGEIIAKSAESMGIKSVRGSAGRRGVAASLELIDKLKEGNNIAIMVDGPKGPAFKVKDGIVNIAKITKIPIIPCAWYSPQKSFISFNTWDKFKAPLGPCQTVALYGDPIYIPEELTKEETQEWCLKIENEMLRLQKDLEENYKTYLNQKEGN